MNLKKWLVMGKIEHAKNLFYSHLSQHKDVPDSSVADSIIYASSITGVSVDDLCSHLRLDLKTLKKEL